MDYGRLKTPKNKTTPQNVEEANQNLFTARWNLPTAAHHCGMSEKRNEDDLLGVPQVQQTHLGRQSAAYSASLNINIVMFYYG